MKSTRPRPISTISHRGRLLGAATLTLAAITALATTTTIAEAARMATKTTKACPAGQTRNSRAKCVKSAVTTKAPATTAAPAGTAAPASTAAPAAGGSVQRDKLTVAFPVEPDQLDDYTGEHRFEGTQMNETLEVQDQKTGAILPWLLSEKPKNTDPFALEWELKLRTDVTFHDGSPFNAQSVIDQITYARTVKGITELGGATNMALLSSFTGSGNTVKLTYSTPQPLLPKQLTYFKVQKIVNGKPSAIGTGPFKLQEWARGSRLVMTAYDKYWGPKPNVKTIEMKYIPDPAARLAALLAGEVDLVTNMSVEDASRAPQLIASDGSLLMYRIQLNNRDGVTQDVRVRQALNYAIDKDGMNKAFFNGQAAIDNCQSLSPGMTGFNASLKPYPYDPAKAKALIKEAGAEGMKMDLYQAADRWTKGLEIVQAVAQMWTAVGIQTTVKNVPFSQWLEVAQKQPGPRPDSFFVGAGLRLQDGSDLRGYLLSTPAVGTISSVSDPQIDKMMIDASAVADEAQRDKAFQTLSAKICRDATFAYLFSPKILTGVAKGVSFTPDIRDARWFKVSGFTFSK